MIEAGKKYRHKKSGRICRVWLTAFCKERELPLVIYAPLGEDGFYSRTLENFSKSFELVESKNESH